MAFKEMHTTFFFFAHRSSIGRGNVVKPKAVQNAMDHVEAELFIGVELVFRGVLESDRGAHEDFAEMLGIPRKGNAVGGRRVLKELLV